MTAHDDHSHGADTATRRRFIRAETLLCPKVHGAKELEYVKELRDRTGESVGLLLLDAFVHLRKHGAIPLFGVLVYALCKA
jgi:hypothetical protein